MPVDFAIPPATILAFMLTLSRVAAVFTFVPFPSPREGFDAPRIVVSLAITMSLVGQWPKIPASEMFLAQIVMMLFQEVLLGSAIGLVVTLVSETFLLAFQIPALQAGYTYASTVDPTTSADSSVLMVISQMACGLMFFSLGLHRELIHAMVVSLQGQPPGQVIIGELALGGIMNMFAVMFNTALRLALPVTALLLMVDLSLALMSRLNSQLQLITVMFPVKMLMTLIMFSWLVVAMPSLYQSQVNHMLTALKRLVAP